MASTLKKKDKMVKKLKAKFGEGDEEEDDEEEEVEEQGPLAITQGLGEDKEEGAKKKRKRKLSKHLRLTRKERLRHSP